MSISQPLTAEVAAPMFTDLGLSEPLLRAIEETGYTHPTPIQPKAQGTTKENSPRGK